MRRGAFITIEGIEGVGKSSCLSTIAQVVEGAGHGALTTREPGGTGLGEKVRDWILDGRHGRLSGEVETLLMFAARSHHLEHVIRPALEQGRWVICDRFTDATFAYQGGGRGTDTAFIDALARAVHGTLNPDLTLLLDAPVDVGFARLGGRLLDHFEREERGFFERARAVYLERRAAEPERIKLVDAAGSLAQVRAAVTALVDAFMRDFDGRES